MSDDEAPELVAVEDEVENGEHVVEQKKIESPVPVCILTGWLGAGKTTLLTRLVKEYGSSGKQIAIIQNEASGIPPTLSRCFFDHLFSVEQQQTKNS